MLFCSSQSPRLVEVIAMTITAYISNKNRQIYPLIIIKYATYSMNDYYAISLHAYAIKLGKCHQCYSLPRLRKKERIFLKSITCYFIYFVRKCFLFVLVPGMCTHFDCGTLWTFYITFCPQPDIQTERMPILI